MVWNKQAVFLNSNVTKVFYGVLCAVGLFTAVSLVWKNS